MDLEKAYDRVDREALWSVLKIYGVCVGRGRKERGRKKKGRKGKKWEGREDERTGGSPKRGGS